MNSAQFTAPEDWGLTEPPVRDYQADQVRLKLRAQPGWVAWPAVVPTKAVAGAARTHAAQSSRAEFVTATSFANRVLDPTTGDVSTTIYLEGGPPNCNVFVFLNALADLGACFPSNHDFTITTISGGNGITSFITPYPTLRMRSLVYGPLISAQSASRATRFLSASPPSS